MNKLDRRNMIFFGLGTIGRDMFYAFEANALIYYLSNVLSLPLGVFLATSMVFTVLRVFGGRCLLPCPFCRFWFAGLLVCGGVCHCLYPVGYFLWPQ